MRNRFDRAVRKIAVVIVALAAISLYMAELKMCQMGLSGCYLTSNQ